MFTSTLDPKSKPTRRPRTPRNIPTNIPIKSLSRSLQEAPNGRRYPQGSGFWSLQASTLASSAPNQCKIDLFSYPSSYKPSKSPDPNPWIPRSRSLDPQIPIPGHQDPGSRPHPGSPGSPIPGFHSRSQSPDPGPTNAQIPVGQIRIADIRSQILLLQKFPSRGGPAAGGVALKIRRAAFYAVPAAFETMLPPTLRRRSAKYTSELVFSIGSEASYTHASEAHSRN